MTAIYINSLKDTRMTAVITALDGQSGTAAIRIGTAGMGTVLATIPLSKPSFSEASQAITLLGTPKSVTASATGTAANAQIVDGAATPNVIISGLSVGTASGDIILSGVNFTSGQQITINSGIISHG